MENTTFKTLASMDFNKHVEVSNGFKYLSWSYAWAEIKKIDQEANYEILENEEGLPFFESKLGIFVKTQVTFNGVTHKMILPVLDGRNKAMKTESYKYKAGKSSFEYECKAADSFDINKAVLRCLVKNIAMHGVGLYIYQGEDIPENLEEVKAPTPVQENKSMETPKKSNFYTKKVASTLPKLSDKDKKIIEESIFSISTKALIDIEILKLDISYSLSEDDKEWVESIKKIAFAKLEKKENFFNGLKNKPLSDVYPQIISVLKAYPDELKKIETFTNKLFDFVTFTNPNDITDLKIFLCQKEKSLNNNQVFLDKVRALKEELFPN